jgi:hypothetical protein
MKVDVDVYFIVEFFTAWTEEYRHNYFDFILVLDDSLVSKWNCIFVRTVVDEWCLYKVSSFLFGKALEVEAIL